MTVGELRELLDGVSDDLEIVVRAWDDENDYCGTITYAEVEYAHDDADSTFLAIDCCQEDDDDG